MMTKVPLWQKVQSNRFIQPFQVRDRANRTLFNRARWLLILSAVAIALMLLVSDRRLNLLLNRDYLERVENSFLSSFYPTYDGLYYWMSYQGNLAVQLDKTLSAEQTPAEFLSDIAPELSQIDHLRYVQFGSVGVNGQWYVVPSADGWQISNEVNQDFAAWLLTQENLTSDRVYWAEARSSGDEIGLFWFYQNDSGDKIYFLAAIDFKYNVPLSSQTTHSGAVLFLADGHQAQTYPLQLTAQEEALSASMTAQLASERANLAPPLPLVSWELLLGEYLHSSSPHEQTIESAQLGNERYWIKLIPVQTHTAYNLLAVVLEGNGPFDQFGLSLPLLQMIVIVFLVLNAGLFIFYYWQYSRRYYFTNQVQEIIKGGESARLEFKSTLRFDLKQKNYNRELENTILKSMAAFNNTDGGMIIIGISDEGKVLGLKNDYETLKKQDKDGFELHLRALISQAYGEHFAARRIDIFFPTLGKQEICLVKIKKGRSPLYTITTDKNGGKLEKFYIRMGNSSREIEKPSDIVDYQNQRFKRSWWRWGKK